MYVKGISFIKDLPIFKKNNELQFLIPQTFLHASQDGPLNYEQLLPVSISSQNFKA